MRKVIVSLLAWLFFATNAQAQNVSEQQQNIINQQQNQVIQNQKQFEREKELQVELKQADKEKKDSLEPDQWEIDNLSENDGKVIQNLRAIQCFRVRDIEFSKNRLLTKSEQNSLSQPYIGKCMTLDWIEKFSKEVTNYLIEKGYATSRAEVPHQNLLEDDRLHIDIIESYLENIQINQNNLFDKMQSLTAFGFIGDKEVLDLHEIDRGVDQMNRLPSNKAVVKITPGTAENKSIIVIENHPKNTLRLNGSLDNIGSRITGKRRDTLSLAKDNLLQLNDSLVISRTANDIDPDYETKRNTSTSGNFSLPLGRHILSLGVSRSSYLFLTGSSGKIRAQGKTLNKTVSFESILVRNKKFKISSNFAISSRHNQNFINDVKTQSSSRKASILTAGVSSKFFLDNASLFLKPAYSKGVNILNARKDAANLPSNTAHADFDIFKFYANYGEKFFLPIFQSEASYNMIFDSQISKQKLYGIDQFSSGGYYSIRGFRSSSISADSGYNIRNEVTANLGELILPRLTSEEISKNLSYLNYLSLTPFYDYGQVRAKGGKQSGRLSGTGFKVGFSKKNINAALTFSHASSKSQLLLQNRNEENIIYFEIGSEIDFF